MKTITATLQAEKDKLVQSELITLIELQLNGTQTLYLSMSDEDITYDSVLYEKWRLSLGERSENTEGSIDTINFSVGNVSREMQAYVEANDGLRGNKLTIKQVYRALLSDPTSYVSETYTIADTNCTDMVVSFRCTSKAGQLAGTRLPLSRVSRSHCDWEYDDPGTCDWTTHSGALDTTNYPLADTLTCDKGMNTPNGCKAHMNETRPRMFPGIPEGNLFV